MDVAFVVMPFADIGRPALGVSLLKQAALDAGFSAGIRYFNIGLAEDIGPELYNKISNAFPPEILLGEWYFADEVFSEDIPAEADYLTGVLSRFADDATIEAIREARRDRTRYLDAAAEKLRAESPCIVGFTSTFHQTCPSLAVARRLKIGPNPPTIIFGGANCEGEMGLQMLESFPWIDYVCSGESDRSFIDLLNYLLRDTPTLPAGVLTRERVAGVPPAVGITDMDSLPVPDFDDYFRQLEDSKLGRNTAFHVVVETSRGCWWGAKHHCTFCGLNGETMKFRSKSPERAFSEIVHLCRKYEMQRVGCVDNILDMRYIDTVFPRLAASGLSLELFYEVKSNLRLDQLQTMRAGGVTQIQPGIESFSDEVLRLMEKGVRGFQNIQLMRWCSELGMQCAWNLLAGFPGESESEYTWMAELIPLLTHLEPPSCCAQVRLDRFSPFYSRSSSFGMTKVRPARAYFFVFPLGRRELARLAYFFDFDYVDGRDPSRYIHPVQQAVQDWWRARATKDAIPQLDLSFEGETARVVDTRPVARARERVLSGIDLQLLMRCDVTSTVPALLRSLDLQDRQIEVEDALARLVANGLMVQRDKHYLTLPVFRNRPINLIERAQHASFQLAKAAPPAPLLTVV
jgi:ribosomal peptide maturation radical SAM protein 1